MQFTLRAIRTTGGYSKEDVSESCGIPIDVYAEIEKDPSETQLSLIYKIAVFCGVSLSLIFPGTEDDCMEYNRSRKKLGNILATQ